MNSTSNHGTLVTSASTTPWVEEQFHFSLFELTQACRADGEQLVALVNEGALAPIGDGPQRWRFAGATLARAHRLAPDARPGAERARCGPGARTARSDRHAAGAAAARGR